MPNFGSSALVVLPGSVPVSLNRSVKRCHRSLPDHSRQGLEKARLRGESHVREHARANLATHPLHIPAVILTDSNNQGMRPLNVFAPLELDAGYHAPQRVVAAPLMQFMGRKRRHASASLSPSSARLNSLLVKRNWTRRGCAILSAPFMIAWFRHQPAQMSSAIQAAACAAPSCSTSRYTTFRPISSAIACAMTSGVACSKSIQRPA